MDTHSPKNLSYPQAYWDAAGAFQRSRAFLSAVELGLFAALGAQERSSDEVAEALGTDRRATDRLMTALAATGILEKRGGRFAHTPEGRRFLLPDSPEYLAGLMHQVNLWESWSTLTAAVRAGTSVVRENRRADAEKTEAFIAAMHDRARRAADGLVTRLDLREVRRVLDVGGGSGAYAAAFVRAGEATRATVFDLPEVLPLTRRFLDMEGASERVDTVGGDYLQDPLPPGFDLVLLSAILHSNGAEENQLLIRKCAAALRPGGWLVIQEFFMDEDRGGPARAALFALNMLVGTERGDTYTVGEVTGWMEAAGFTGMTRMETGPETAALVGRKEH